MTTVRLIGSNILFDLANRNYSGDINILDSILWHSPFAMVDLDYEHGTMEENMGCGTDESSRVLSLEIKKNLEEMIHQNPTEYIIIESMGACWYNLLEVGGRVYTNCRFIGNSSWYQEHKDKIKEINLKHNPEFDWKSYFDIFIQVIQRYYPANKIIYIRSHFPKYCKVKTFIKDMMISEKSNSLMKKIDDYFIKTTNCKEISIGESFFSDVQSKYGNKICFYENDFYTTLLENINYAIADKCEQKVFNKIKFSIRLKRYIECYESIQFNKLVNAFWNRGIWLEELTYLLGKKALLVFRSQLLIMSENNVKCISDMTVHLDCSQSAKELIKLAYVIDAIKEKRYDASVDWHLAFLYEIEALNILNNDISNIFKNRFNVEDVDFALEKNFRLIQACILKGKNLSGILPVVLEKRYGIDIWGSCVTREIFNYSRVKWGGVQDICL